VFISQVILETGMMPGVLFLVSHLWRCLVVFSAHLAAGFLVFIIASKFVRRSMVMIDVSSITLCLSSSMRNHVLFATICSSRAGSGFSKSSIFWPRDCNHLFPLGVQLAIAVASANLSVSALRC
jgi:hypothetical protein